MKSQFPQIILEKRVVPVVVIDDAADAVPLAKAFLAAGLNVIEITFRTAAAEQSIRNIARDCPDMLIGAGTILAPDQIKRAVAAGAHFGVAPGLNENIVRQSQAAGLPFIPGVMTPSDVEQALGLGFKLLKFFPAEPAGGVKMLKALAGPYAHTGVKFIPLGGITAKNAAEYLALPIVAAIGGSWLAEKSLMGAKNWQEISRLAKEAMEIAKV